MFFRHDRCCQAGAVSSAVDGAKIRDETGAIHDDVTNTPDSGFDYPDGVELHDATVVPLPAPCLLLLGGLAGFGVRGRRRPTSGSGNPYLVRAGSAGQCSRGVA